MAAPASPVDTKSAPVPGWKRTRHPSWKLLCGMPMTIGVQLVTREPGAAFMSTSKRATRLSTVVE